MGLDCNFDLLLIVKLSIVMLYVIDIVISSLLIYCYSNLDPPGPPIRPIKAYQKQIDILQYVFAGVASILNTHGRGKLKS